MLLTTTLDNELKLTTFDGFRVVADDVKGFSFLKKLKKRGFSGAVDTRTSSPLFLKRLMKSEMTETNLVAWSLPKGGITEDLGRLFFKTSKANGTLSAESHSVFIPGKDSLKLVSKMILIKDSNQAAGLIPPKRKEGENSSPLFQGNYGWFILVRWGRSALIFLEFSLTMFNFDFNGILKGR